ncbi:hypothetical protein Tco_0331641 [Tanacetum coccineum]
MGHWSSLLSNREDVILEGDDSGVVSMVGNSRMSRKDITPLPPADQRHPWLRYQVKGYTEDIVHDYDHRLETIRGRHLRRHAKGRKSKARLSGGHFTRRLIAYFGLVNDQGLRGLSVVTCELPSIDLHELGRLNIYERIGDTWAWVDQDQRGSRVSTWMISCMTQLMDASGHTYQAFDSTIVGSSQDLAETMIWYILKKTCVELIRAF